MQAQVLAYSLDNNTVGNSRPLHTQTNPTNHKKFPDKAALDILLGRNKRCLTALAKVWAKHQCSLGRGWCPAAAGVGVAAGAVAGIVIGTTLGGILTASIGWVAYREYQKRRLKRFYK